MKIKVLIILLLFLLSTCLTGCQKEATQPDLIPSPSITVAPMASSIETYNTNVPEDDRMSDSKDSEPNLYNSGSGIYVIGDEDENETGNGDSEENYFTENNSGIYVIEDDDDDDDDDDEENEEEAIDSESDISTKSKGGIYVIEDGDEENEDEESEDEESEDENPTGSKRGIHVIEDDDDEFDNDTLIPIPGIDGYAQINLIDCYASSFLVAKSGKGDYSTAMATDGADESSWQFSLDDISLGKAFIVLEFIESCSIDELWIKNGFWKINVYDQYSRNGRIKSAGISFRYEGENTFQDEMVISLKDDKQHKTTQKVSLGRHENVNAIKIRVLSIYKGSKFPKDVAVSEIIPVTNLHGDTVTIVPRVNLDVSTLEINSSGQRVLQLKERLQALGYIAEGKSLTESYTKSVSKKVKQFQKKNGLPETGIADSATLTLLYSDEALPQ